jgi:hypothetical protein
MSELQLFCVFLSAKSGYVGVPKQLVITGDAASIPSSVAAAGLKLPLVAKPLVADGTAKSHALSLAYDKYCLTELEPPLVLQEFVNHGGVLFKVYVVGDQIRVVRRFSLPDVKEGQSESNGLIPFPRVSCAAATAEDADLDPQAAGRDSTYVVKSQKAMNVLIPAVLWPVFLYNWKLSLQAIFHWSGSVDMADWIQCVNGVKGF